MDQIEELLTRGVSNIYPSKEELEKKLKNGDKLTLYQGFDPTGSQLHLGHMVGLKKLRQWQDMGHHVIFLIGDFTGMIGDPSGKSKARKVLTHEEVLENAKSYKEQAGKILRFSGKNPVEIKFNGEWLGKLSAIDFIKISRHLSVNQVIERDMFQERLKTDEDIYLNEFSYPVMQAYDSVVMQVDLEIGGNDQMFNMLLGRKLMRNMLKKEKFVLTTPLLTDSEGRKIGKTEGNVIALTDKPNDLFGKIMALPDDIILKGFEYLTNISLDEIKKIEKNITKGDNPIKYKKQLAFEITKDLSNTETAQKAQESFQKTVQKKQLPDEIPEVKISTIEPVKLDQLIVESGLAPSKAEAKRLIEQGAIQIGDTKITDPFQTINLSDNLLLKAGKRKIIRIKINKL
jgi:tyrosyl-tRNA synthetase